MVYVVAVFDAPTVTELAVYLTERYPHVVSKVCPSQPLAETLGNLLPLLQPSLKHVGDHFPRDIVIGWPEPSAQHDQPGTFERVAHEIRQLGAIVADDTFDHDLDPEGVQLLGDVERVGVDAQRCQQLAAHRDDGGSLERRRSLLRHGGVHASHPGIVSNRIRMTRLP